MTTACERSAGYKNGFVTAAIPRTGSRKAWKDNPGPAAGRVSARGSKARSRKER